MYVAISTIMGRIKVEFLRSRIEVFDVGTLREDSGAGLVLYFAEE